MALVSSKAQFMRAVSARAYSQVVPVSGTVNYEVKTTVLPNKLVVASADNEAPIARVSILYRAGSRNETGDNLGSTHVLRIAAGLSTVNSSQFGIMRNLQQSGAMLSCMASREIVAYTLEGTRKAIEDCMPYLTDVATEQVFKPWELHDNTHRLKLELATRPPQQRVIDLLHKAAYRKGLGNSIYISKHQIGKVSSETLQHYVATNFKSNRAAIVALGVDHSELVNYAQSLQLESGSDQTGPGKYKGGEIRSDKGGSMAYIAVAGEGGTAKTAKEIAVFSVLRRALGAGASAKYCNESQSILSKSLGNVNEAHALQAFNINYSDSGLFGVMAVGNHKIASKLMETAVKTLKSGKISEQDVVRAKNQFKTEALSYLESGTNAIEFLGQYALLTGALVSPRDVPNIIDSVTTAEVDAALKKVSSSKLSIAAFGNLDNVPFSDEIR